MLIKNTNPNELLAEFERDGNFCPYNEKEFERLKKEAEQLREDTSCHIGMSHNGVWFSYNLSYIDNKGVRYEYGKYGDICEITTGFSKELTEYVRFENFGKIVFFHKIKTSDDSSVWSLEVTRMGDQNQEAWLWIGGEVKYKKFGIE